MKIVLSPSGSRGDVYPIIYLGRELKKRGHDIHIVASPDYREFCEKEYFTFSPMGTEFKVIMESFTHNMGKPIKVMKDGITIFNSELQSYYETLMTTADDADLIIASGLQFTGALVAHVKKIPYRYMAHIPILIPSKYHSPFFVPYQNLPKWINSLLWSGNMFVMGLTIGRTLNKIREDNGLKKIKKATDHVERENVVIAVSPELGIIPPDNSDVGLQIDYFFDTDERELSEEVIDFINSGDAPVYFGFGSMTDGHPEKTLDVIFKSIKQLGVRAIISRGWANYTHDLIPEGVFFAGEEPHGKLFPHMRVIVHHGGAGTTSTAARAGIPQITAPHVLDQYYWTDRIKKLGISPGGIKKRKFNVNTLTSRLKDALENKEINRKAKELGGKLVGRNGVFQLANVIEKELVKMV